MNIVKQLYNHEIVKAYQTIVPSHFNLSWKAVVQALVFWIPTYTSQQWWSFNTIREGTSFETKLKSHLI